MFLLVLSESLRRSAERFYRGDSTGRDQGSWTRKLLHSKDANTIQYTMLTGILSL